MAPPLDGSHAAMKRETIAALADINRRFYSLEAEAFDRTRDRGWRGWQHVVELLQERVAGVPRIVDLGCGNGRFCRYLEEHVRRDFDYLGVDGSRQLLEAASAAGRSREHRYRLLDLLDWLAGPPGVFDRSAFELVAIFGVMHHLPSFGLRRRLLEHAVDLLAPGGLVAVSFWQLSRDPRFERRRLPWSAADLDSRLQDDLEAGDHLLRWGGNDRSQRYCHEARPEEIDRLLQSLSARIVERFRDDGPDRRLNEYAILAASEGRLPGHRQS